MAVRPGLSFERTTLGPVGTLFRPFFLSPWVVARDSMWLVDVDTENDVSRTGVNTGISGGGCRVWGRIRRGVPGRAAGGLHRGLWGYRWPAWVTRGRFGLAYSESFFASHETEGIQRRDVELDTRE